MCHSASDSIPVNANHGNEQLKWRELFREINLTPLPRDHVWAENQPIRKSAYSVCIFALSANESDSRIWSTKGPPTVSLQIENFSAPGVWESCQLGGARNGVRRRMRAHWLMCRGWASWFSFLQHRLISWNEKQYGTARALANFASAKTNVRLSCWNIWKLSRFIFISLILSRFMRQQTSPRPTSHGKNKPQRPSVVAI